MITLIRHISALTHAEVEFGLIPKEHWVQPPSIDEEKATAAREKMVKENVIYGGACLPPNYYIMSFSTPQILGSIPCVGYFISF